MISKLSRIFGGRLGTSLFFCDDVTARLARNSRFGIVLLTVTLWTWFLVATDREESPTQQSDEMN